ncbi:LysR family transcriptional regulator [Poseidonocella sp. HB161398]|uniref:LysR family transcriptional regulator n=1 Tax=Poseidonocella sp. HB161398 TaxID=2320855 RepID=UPI0011089990|nr:LysR family transcriptional regulator [Poseidonocella sp. HB161398]
MAMGPEPSFKDLDLNLLLIFDGICHRGSISRAVETLNISQPPVSNARNRLRVQPDDRRYIRSACGVRPTAQAMDIAGPISEAMATLRVGIRSGAAFAPRKSEREFVVVLHDCKLPGILAPLVKVLDDGDSRGTIHVHSPDWSQPCGRLVNARPT